MMETTTKRQNERFLIDLPHRPETSRQSRMKRTKSPARPSIATRQEQPGLFPEKTSPVPERRFSVVSMFSGCGGMDLGFHGGFTVFGHEYSPLPFEVIWANEHNK